jgi:hypothetical protein
MGQVVEEKRNLRRPHPSANARTGLTRNSPADRSASRFEPSFEIWGLFCDVLLHRSDRKGRVSFQQFGDVVCGRGFL